MKTKLKSFGWLVLVLGALGISGNCRASELLIDHTCANIYAVPTNWIEMAKQKLRIAYGHRSHGAQLTDGMAAMIGFMTNKGYAPCLYSWTQDGNTCSDALTLPENPYGGPMDLGYYLGTNGDYSSWAAATRSYLATNTSINVVIWSWSSELAGATADNVDTYLSLMAGLRHDYPNIQFVYMTGCLDGQGATGNGNLRNEQIRSHCLTNGLILYDFANIESYDPTGLTNYMLLNADDGCNYALHGGTDRTNNWALEWQTNHVVGVDWYDMVAAHSQPLNGNRKAYSAWWLWARLAGWPGPVPAPQIQLESQGAPVLIYIRPPGVPTNSYYFQYSRDFLNWSNVSPQMIVSQDETVTNGGVQVRTHLLADTIDGVFYRLRVSDN